MNNLLMMEVIVTVDDAQLLYDKDNRIIIMRFAGNMSDAAYKELWSRSIDFAEIHKINRGVIDQQEIGSISFNARAWVVLTAFPRVKSVVPNSLAAAILSSNKIVPQTGMRYLLKAFRSLIGYKVEVFPSLEEAVIFLQSANEPS